ncbi:m7GpppX diphosphatase [Lampris incognitus]|uniref:m7GpppX diphosphatase n=1 Tax=Lampris incognitus TaxID=2546036 RepID=UPI0024B4F68C|nr:m7GpppX diphosphatase [Lampris incognitus]XP_056144078.1 m7GpppX diphosphatase [Lampris incognitus]
MADGTGETKGGEDKSLGLKKRRSFHIDHEDTKENVLADFSLSSVLNYSVRDKRIFIHGKLDGQEAVVILEKTPIGEDILEEMFRGSKLEAEMSNDIYSTYKLQPPAHLNEIKTTVVCPATEKHVKKYQRQERHLVKETGESYSSITLPYIEQQSFSLQWVYNILEKKAEADRILFEDLDQEVGFVLLPDFKWDQKQLDDLFLLALVRQRKIKSLRDLNADHLPLLRNIYEKGTEVIMRHYGLPASKLRIYFHYQPSYYHLHIHFNALNYEVPGSSVERAHLLLDVIENLVSDPQYYKTRTLYFPISEDDGLLNRFKEARKL